MGWTFGRCALTGAQIDYEDAVREHGSIRKAAKALGVPRSTIQDRLGRGYERGLAVRGEIGGPPIPEAAVPPEGFAVFSNNGAYDADGKLLRQWVGTKRDSGEVFEIPQGQVLKEMSALVDADGRQMLRWIKTKEGGTDVAGLVEALQSVFDKYDGSAPEIVAPTVSDADLMTIYPIPDLHFGMYSWGDETGDDYDTKIAATVAKSGITTLVSQSLPSERAVVLVLGDYFHQNDQSNVTPGHKHQLDVDGRWFKVYDEGAALLCEIIKIVSAKHSMVEVKILPGNHDDTAAGTLTVAMSLFFSRTRRITVNKEPGDMYYRRFGSCLIGAHHGHKMKPEAMAMAMAVDRHEDWGQTKFRSYYSGHIHHETAKEVMGVRVESFSSPAARDSFNASHGYRSGRSMSAVTFHRDNGEIGRHRVNIA